jgi:deoxyadenosine/deoxycytidine kinase
MSNVKGLSGSFVQFGFSEANEILHKFYPKYRKFRFNLELFFVCLMNGLYFIGQNCKQSYI